MAPTASAPFSTILSVEPTPIVTAQATTVLIPGQRWVGGEYCIYYTLCLYCNSYRFSMSTPELARFEALAHEAKIVLPPSFTPLPPAFFPPFPQYSIMENPVAAVEYAMEHLQHPAAASPCVRALGLSRALARVRMSARCAANTRLMPRRLAIRPFSTLLYVEH